jgi:hypothetical protein
MDRANLAEWILRQVVGPFRAAELIGDRLEARPGEGNLRFWLSNAWLVVVFSWRTVVGILAASTAGVLFSWIPFAFAFTRFFAMETKPSFGWDATYYLAMSQLFWTAAAFSLVQFGFRSHLARISLLGALLSTFAVCTFWLPFGSTAVLVGSSLFVLLCLRRSKDRRAVAVLFSALASGGIMMRTMASLPRLSGNPDLKLVLVVVLIQMLLIASVECLVALILHKRLLGSDTIQPEKV